MSTHLAWAAEPGNSVKFSDPVHGEYVLPKQAAAIIDTPQFQRLRELKQLGLRLVICVCVCVTRHAALDTGMCPQHGKHA